MSLEILDRVVRSVCVLCSVLGVGKIVLGELSDALFCLVVAAIAGGFVSRHLARTSFK